MNPPNGLRPGTDTHRVAMLGYPNAQILDITGPLEVFGRASRWIAEHPSVAQAAYSVELIGLAAGPLRTSSGIELTATRGYRDVDPAELDTLLISGGIGWRAAAEDRQLLDWLVAAWPQLGRLASVCTGALLLARTGLLDGRRATTHWAYCDELREYIGADAVEDDAIFVRSGTRLLTSAGVTAGMDMALAMVADDCGRHVALAVARELVMFVQRSGNQAQLSLQLRAQQTEIDRIERLQEWMLEHPQADLSVAALAGRCAMSPRNFARRFVDQLGITPARYVEQLRVEAARRRLAQTTLTQEAIARSVGFGSRETMRRSFLRLLGAPPGNYRSGLPSATHRSMLAAR